jgi:hypothetical protein
MSMEGNTKCRFILQSSVWLKLKLFSVGFRKCGAGSGVLQRCGSELRLSTALGITGRLLHWMAKLQGRWVAKLHKR